MSVLGFFGIFGFLGFLSRITALCSREACHVAPEALYVAPAASLRMRDLI
jgi:hypothetical protein